MLSRYVPHKKSEHLDATLLTDSAEYREKERGEENNQIYNLFQFYEGKMNLLLVGTSKLILRELF